MIEALLWSDSWIVKSSLFLLLIICIHFICRRRVSASVRHCLWIIGFTGMLLAPILSHFATVSETEIFLPVAGLMEKSAGIESEVPLSSVTITQLALQASELSPVKLEPVAYPTEIDWSSILKIIWICGMILCLLLLIVEKGFLQMLYLKSRDGDGPLYDMMHEIHGQFLLKNQVRIAVSEHIDIPFTQGFISPVIYLPAKFMNYDEHQQRLIFMHELAHIRRLDSLATFIIHLSRALFWFNPLVWMAAKWSKIDMEKACDDLVIDSSKTKYEYASLILDIIESTKSKNRKNPDRLAVAAKMELWARMTAILDEGINRRKIGKLPATLIVLCAFLTLAILASLKVVNSSEAESYTHADIKPYVEVLETGSDEELKYAAWVIGTSEQKSAAGNLIKQLNHKNPEVRSMIVWALGEVKEPSSVKILAEMTKDPSPLVREMAVKSLGELEISASTEILANLLEDTSIGVRTAAVWSLGEIGNQRAQKMVFKALQDSAPQVQEMAVKVLGKTQYHPAFYSLSTLLEGQNSNLKVAAVYALCELRSEQAFMPLQQALSDDDAVVRFAAANALGKLRNKNSAAALIPLLQDPSLEVREMVVWALDELQL